ncbi:MAG: TRIC cation channel family protein [Candidatus Acidiferrales bacterium]
MPATSLFSIIDFLGVVAGALGGALAARHNERYDYDIVGLFGLALVSALGGGITRDVLIERGPPLAFVDVRYLYAAIGGAFLGFAFGSRLGSKTKRILIFVDAAALALFAVSGATRALNSNLSILPALVLGVVTAVGGGSLRDVLSGTTPRVFERGELYAIVAAISASVFLACDYAGLPRIISTSFGIGFGFLFRLVSLHFGWQTKSVRQG